jgi:hypothetical protein
MPPAQVTMIIVMNWYSWGYIPPEDDRAARLIGWRIRSGIERTKETRDRL